MLASPPQHPLQPRRAVVAKGAAPQLVLSGAPSADDGARRANGHGWLELKGVTRHNLRALDAALPLARLVCVSGVSGSGKSTLIRDVLHDNLVRLVGRERRVAARHGKAPELANVD